jgi:hypothetical protein
MNAQNIVLFLMDGSPTERIKATLVGTTTIAYKIPRIRLDKCKDRKHLQQAGVYFLFGKTSAEGDDFVYIGQANVRSNEAGILFRLQEHLKNVEYWTEAVVFTTENNSFGSTEISFLEHHFHRLATKANRYTLTNGNTPNEGNITEEKQAELEQYIENASLLLGSLGYRVLEPYEEERKTKEKGTEEDEPEILFYMKSRDFNATGSQTNEGFLVHKDSAISEKVTKAAPKAVFTSRTKYKEKIDETGKMSSSILFSSPSAAAGFVAGYSVSGPEIWKTKDGKRMKDLGNR